MNIIAVDDEIFALDDLESAITEACQKTALQGVLVSRFDVSAKALEYAKTSRVDIAFLDVEMSGMNGLQLAKQLKEIYKKTYIVFVTGYSQYAIDAFTLRAGGYIMKPVTVKAVSEEIEFFRLSVQEQNLPEPIMPTSKKRLRVQTFGNFDLFVDGKQLSFSRSKTKELFAYLVIRKGAQCNNNEIAAVIWEDKDDTVALQNSFRKLVMDLTQTLCEAGIHDVLIKKRGYLALDPDKISCDFYDFCAGINVNQYMGEFMNQYGWAEFTNSYLDRTYKKKTN